MNGPFENAELESQRTSRADAQQAGVDAVEATRDPAAMRPRTFEQTKEDEQRAMFALIGANATLRADVERLKRELQAVLEVDADLRGELTKAKGERDALRTAYEEMSRAWHKQARHGGSWEECDALCHGHRAALEAAK